MSEVKIEYLTVREAALELGIHPMTMANWLDAGRFPSLSAIPVGYEHGELMTVAEVAARLGVTGQTIKNWLVGVDGIILEPVRVGRQYAMILVPVGRFEVFREWRFPDGRIGDDSDEMTGEKPKTKWVIPVRAFREFQRKVFPTLDVRRGRRAARAG